MIGIYIIKCTKNNKVYIGQSVNIKHRFYEHKGLLKNNKHINSHLQNAFNKYGEEFFVFEVLETIDENDYTKEKLDALEKQYISKFKSNERDFGYNIENGGNGVGMLGIETRKKLSLALKGNHNNANAWIGKHHTDETKKILSQKLKGRTSHWKGKTQTAEHIEKARQKKIGRVWVHNESDSRFVTKEEADILLNNGFVFGRPFQNRIKGKKYEYKGNFYTLPQISEMSGVKVFTLRNRLNSGMTIEQATTAPITETYGKGGKFFYNGEFVKMTYIAKSTGIEYEKLRSQLRKGLSIEEAISKLTNN